MTSHAGHPAAVSAEPISGGQGTAGREVGIIATGDVAQDTAPPPAARRPPASPAGSRPWQEGLARAAGAVVTLAAIWSIVSLFSRGPLRRLGDDLFGLVNVPVGPTVFSVALLFLLAGTVHRRLRVGVWTLLAFQLLALADAGAEVALALNTGNGSLLRHFAVRERVELVVSVLGAVVLIPALWAARPAFPARLYPGSRRLAPVVLLLG